MENNEKEFVFTADDLDLPIDTSINEEVSENNKDSYLALVQTIFAQNISIENIDTSKLRKTIAEVFKTLSPRERDVLRLRFGMDDGRKRYHKEIAELFGTTEEDIQIIEAKAFRKLRHPNRANHLRKFLGMEEVKKLSES